MKLLDLLCALEQRLGYNHLPVNAQATSIKDIFESSPVHQELMTQLVRAIYTANACRTLAHPVLRNETFAAFAPIRLEALRSSKCDVDTHRLIDELCNALEQIFAAETVTARPVPAKSGDPTGEVITLDAVRRRRILKTWT